MPGLDSTEKITLFTFLIEKEGSTLIEQVPAADVEEALLKWRRLSQINPEMAMDDPTPVQGVERVWCITGQDVSGTFFLAHIVASSV